MFWKMHSTVAANHKLAQDRHADLADTPVQGVLLEDMLTVTSKDYPKTVLLAFARVMDRVAFLLERNGCLFH